MLIDHLVTFLISCGVCYFLIRFNPFGHRAKTLGVSEVSDLGLSFFNWARLGPNF